MSTSRSLFQLRRQLVIITLAFSGVMTSIIIALWPYFTAWYHRLMNPLDSPCDCSQLAILPDQSLLLFGLVASVSIFIVLIVRSAIKIFLTYYKTRQYEKRLQTLVQHHTRIKGISVYRIVSQKPLAVCLGYFRPRIYISTALEQLLIPTELWTVLKHELHHAHQRDPLQRLLIGGLTALMPWSQKTLADYQALQEVVADEAAADDQQLRRALVKTLGATIEQPVLSAVWFSATDARLNRLLGYRMKRPKVWPIVSLMMGIGFVTTLMYHSFTAQAQAAVFGQCIAEQPMCELLMSYVAE